MGLTIHYSLTAKTRSAAKALKMVEALRQRCLDLPFKEVGEVVDLSGKQCDFNLRDKEDPLRWFLIQSDTSVSYVWKRKLDAKTGLPTMRAVKPAENDHSRFSMGVLPLHVIGFTAWPGEGCEESNVGLCLFPPTVEVEHYGYKDTMRVGAKGWSWHSFCKTQYANDPAVGGLANFLRCHLTVCAMLEAAKALGLQVNVSDEGDYWEKRDVKALAANIGEWDKMIAGFGGAMKDALGGSALGLETAMDGRTDSESLEAHAPADIAEKARQLAQLVKALVPAVKGE